MQLQASQGQLLNLISVMCAVIFAAEGRCRLLRWRHCWVM